MRKFKLWLWKSDPEGITNFDAICVFGFMLFWCVTTILLIKFLK